jgi:hypothetical protein
MVNKEDIKAALVEIKSFKDLNYYKIVYNYNLTYITLIRRANS